MGRRKGDAPARYGWTPETRAQFQEVKARYGSACVRCGRKEPAVKLTRDHVIPTKYGGTLDTSNIQPLCLRCNASKSDASIDYRPDSPAPGPVPGYPPALRTVPHKELHAFYEYWRSRLLRSPILGTANHSSNRQHANTKQL